MTACPRRDCGGTLGIFSYGTTCHQCARGEVAARPPSAFQMHSRGAGIVTEPNYFGGIYAIGYVPTRDELTRARDW